MPVVTTALEATMVIESRAGSRAVPAAEFFQGHYTTALQSGEILTRIDIKPTEYSWGFEEVARRRGDFALVMAATGLHLRAGRCRSARIVLGSVSDRPERALEAEAFLEGKAVDAATATEAARLATHSLKARSDIHASAAYRRSVAGVVIRRALMSAAAGSAS
jgi:carbon-monoxide dehydrogenase medium subunit